MSVSPQYESYSFRPTKRPCNPNCIPKSYKYPRQYHVHLPLSNMSYSRPMSPPPPCPSPQLHPTPLPSPPVFRPGRSRRTQRTTPPISPRILGSPLLSKQLNTARSYERINEKAKATLWVDGDEFGSDRPECDKEQRNSAPTPPRRRVVTRRQSALHIRTHSPPPSPTLRSPPPPVPPIPAFALSLTDKKPVLHTPPPLPTWPAKIIPDYSPEGAERAMMRRKRGVSAPYVTCSQFMAMHNTAQGRNGGITV